jgi:uncharacterized protein (TIGR02284 family)
MDELVRSLKALHTSLIDANQGYEEGLKDAHGEGLAPLFAEMIALHGKDADAISEQLKRLGADAGDRGSWMGAFDRTVMKISSLFTKLDDKFLPSLADGEKQVLDHYDRAIAASSPGNAEYPVLVKQRDALREKVAGMRAGKPA